MTISRRTTYLSILLLIALTLLYRYPFTPHEWGVDSFFIHSTSQSIITYGRAKWILSPFSYIGMYPLSTPSGMEFVLSSLSTMSGVSMEGVIYFAGLLFAIAGCLGTFLLAYDVKGNHLFSLLSALLFTTAPFYISGTIWTMSTRPYLVSLVPMFILLLVRYYRTGNVLWLILCGISFLFLLTLHRIAFLLVFIVTAYMLSGVLLKVIKKSSFHYIMTPKRKTIIYVGLTSLYAATVVYAQYSHPYGHISLSQAYSEGALLSGHSIVIILVNILINFTGKIGLLFPLGIFAVVLYHKVPLKGRKDHILLLSILFSLAFLVIRAYISMFLISFFSFFMAAAIVFFIMKDRHLRRKVAITLVALLLISSLFFSWGMRNYWAQKPTIEGGKSYLTDSTYSTGLYVRHNSNGNLIGNVEIETNRLGAITGHYVQPSAGTNRPLSLLIYNIEKTSDILVTPLKLDELSFNSNYLFKEEEGLNTRTAWYKVMTSDSSVIQTAYYNHYNLSYVVEDKLYEGEIFSGTGGRPSYFLNQMHGENYIIYSNEKFNVWRYTP